MIPETIEKAGQIYYLVKCFFDLTGVCLGMCTNSNKFPEIKTYSGDYYSNSYAYFPEGFNPVGKSYKEFNSYLVG